SGGLRIHERRFDSSRGHSEDSQKTTSVNPRVTLLPLGSYVATLYTPSTDTVTDDVPPFAVTGVATAAPAANPGKRTSIAPLVPRSSGAFPLQVYLREKSLAALENDCGTAPTTWS